jgi:hypothetical protein
MKNNRVVKGTALMIALLLFAIVFTYVALGSQINFLNMGFWPLFFVFLIEACVVFGIIRWVAAAPTKEAHANRKVDKVLRELDSDELSLLRNRLMYENRNAEPDYDSMAEVMQSGKRKNDVR